MAPTHRLEWPGGIALEVAERGATWLTLEVPLPGGERRGVILERRGIDDAGADSAFLGATVGRYANRIAQARIALDDRHWALAPNPGSRHQLHGGPGGFHSRRWQAERQDARAVVFRLRSAEGDQGFPGQLDVQVSYRLADALTVEMEAIATTTAPCPVALTNHAYFNLDGDGADVRDHTLRIAAQAYVPVDAELIPLGPLAPVQGTGFDFRAAKALRQDWLRDAQQQLAGGYDHGFLLDADRAAMDRPAAELRSSRGDLALDIHTNQPALQLYTGQYLAGIARPPQGSYAACAGIALEPGFLPDSPNHPEWPQPSCWLQPGQTYRHLTRYVFRCN